MKLVPLSDRVVLKQLEAEETTKSGIILTSSAQEKPQEAEVIAVGPGGMVDGKEVKNGGKVEEGTRKITVTQADEPGTITLKVGDKVIESHEFTGVYDSFDFTDVNVNADITVTFEKKPEEVTHKVNIEDKVNDQNAKLTGIRI